MKKGFKTHLTRLKSSASSAQDPWWVKKLKDEPIKVTSIGTLTFGGLMLMMFFVGYLHESPDIDLKSSAALLWALATTGGIVTVFFLLVPALPGLYVKGSSVAWRSTLSHLLWLSAPAVATAMWVLVFIGLDLKPAMLTVPTWGLLCGIFLIAYDARLDRLTQEMSVSTDKHPSKAELLADMLVGSLAWLFTLSLGFLFAVALYAHEQFDNWTMMLVITAQLTLTYVSAVAIARLDWAKEKMALLILALVTIAIPAFVGKNISAIRAC